MYGDIAFGESTARKWFSRYKEDHFDISDTPRLGRPSIFDEDRLNTLVHNDPHQYTREVANMMNCNHSTMVLPPGPQRWTAGGHMCISAFSSSFGS